jgi:hypothetical protein
MKRIACYLAVLTVSATAGCVERRFTVYSDPPGALVWYNGNYLGITPTDGYVTFYGKQQFRLIHEGYETLDVAQDYSPPWFDWPGIDFLTENIYPGKLRDVRQFHYTMRPLLSIPLDDVRARAEELRARGQNIGVPLPPRPLAPSKPASPPGTILEAPTPQGTLPAPRPVPTPAPPPPAGVNGLSP